MLTSRHYWQRSLSMWCLVFFLLATAVPRFGTLWHSHTGGEASHTHDVYTVVRDRHAPHTQQFSPPGQVHSHAHDYSHDHDHPHHVDDHDQHVHHHAHPHEPAEDVQGRFVDASPHSLHAHYFDDSLPAGCCLLSLPTLVVLTVFLRCCCLESPPLRHLSPPTACAPPVVVQV
jgi:hypothetical protein